MTTRNCFSMHSKIHNITALAWGLLWLMLPLSMKGTVVALWAVGILALLGAFIRKPLLSRQQWILAGMFFVFFLWHVASVIIHPGPAHPVKILERQASYVLIPLILLLLRRRDLDYELWAIRGLFSGLLLSGIHMLVLAVKALMGSEDGFSTYHDFTGPYSLGAIYYSWYLSAALLYLLYRDPEPFIRKYRYLVLACFLLLMLLSASKLFILFMVPAILWGVLRNQGNIKNKKLVGGLVLVILLLGSVPFLKRVSELKNTDLRIVSQEQFSYDTPFNGVTIRLLQWRFAFEILDEQGGWLTGTGTGNKQLLLNEQYRRYGVYTGNPDLGDKGYLDYNFHNQYIETLVGTGFAGFVILLLLLGYILAGRNIKQAFPKIFFVLTVMFFMTESVLDRQAGIVFFCLTACMIVERHNQTFNGRYSREKDYQPGDRRKRNSDPLSPA